MSSVPRNELEHTKEETKTVASGSRPCNSCRGRGWKHITSRLDVVNEVIDDTADVSDKQPCRSCAGTGRASRPDARRGDERDD